jgi:hypothetical protein
MQTCSATFRCPITLCVIREPAVTPAGISYERSALMQWLDHQHTEAGLCTSSRIQL